MHAYVCAYVIFRPKHPLKVHVWAGISLRCVTQIFIFDCFMDAPLYVEILRSTLLPFIVLRVIGLCKTMTQSILIISIGRRRRRQVNPRTKEELIDGIKAFSELLPKKSVLGMYYIAMLMTIHM